MRATTIAASLTPYMLVVCAILFVVGCVAPVGRQHGGDDDDEPDAATGDGGDGECVMKTTMNLARPADVPSGCWDAGTLTVSGVEFRDLDDLGDLRTVTDLTLNNNPNLTGARSGGTIDVTGKFVIRNNPRLADLDAFAVTSLLELEVANNERITTLTLDQVDISGPITITDNQGLQQITLDTVVENLTIRNNPQLVTVLGLTTSVNGNFILDNNDSLQQLNLSLLRRVTGALTITNNAQLANFDPLYLATQIGSATISNNQVGDPAHDCRVQEIDHCVPGLEFAHPQVQGCCRCVDTTHE